MKILIVVFYSLSMLVSLLTLSIIVRNWETYGKEGQKYTRLHMAISNSSFSISCMSALVFIVCNWAAIGQSVWGMLAGLFLLGAIVFWWILLQ